VIKALRACSLLSKAHQIRRINAAVYNSLEGVGCGVLRAAKGLPLLLHPLQFRKCPPRGARAIARTKVEHSRRQRFKVPSHRQVGGMLRPCENPSKQTVEQHGATGKGGRATGCAVGLEQGEPTPRASVGVPRGA
jgi:hypothetical protein